MILIYAAVLAHPTYIGCNLTTTVSAFNRNIGRTLAIGQPLMQNNQILPGNMPPIFTPKINGGYIPKQTYTITITNTLDNAAGAYYANKGTVTPGICTSTGIINAGASPTFQWEAPESGTVHISYITANFGAGAFMAIYTLSTTDAPQVNLDLDAQQIPEITCQNESLTGSKNDEKWMIFGLVLVWAIGVQIARINHTRLILVQYTLSVAIVALAAVFAVTEDIKYNTVYYSAAAYLILSAIISYTHILVLIQDTGKWFVLTLLFVSGLTSFHHWCNGEQDWDYMSGDWGDFNSWQGTLPLWAFANIIAVWTIYSKKTSHKIYAMQILIVIISIAAFRPWELSGKDVPKWTIYTVAAFFGPWAIGMPYYYYTHKITQLKLASFEVQMTFVAIMIITATIIPQGNAKHYQNYSTIIMMTTCTVVGLSWAILAVLYADKANINAFAPYNLSYKPYSGGSLNTFTHRRIPHMRSANLFGPN